MITEQQKQAIFDYVANSDLEPEELITELEEKFPAELVAWYTEMMLSLVQPAE